MLLVVQDVLVVVQEVLVVVQEVLVVVQEVLLVVQEVLVVVPGVPGVLVAAVKLFALEAPRRAAIRVAVVWPNHLNKRLQY